MLGSEVTNLFPCARNVITCVVSAPLVQCANFSNMYHIDDNLMPMCYNALFCYVWSNVNFQWQINYYQSHEIGINSFI